MKTEETLERAVVTLETERNQRVQSLMFMMMVMMMIMITKTNVKITFQIIFNVVSCFAMKVYGGSEDIG